MRSKAGMGRAVLSLGAQTNTVVESGLELVEVGPHDVDAFVCDQSRQALPYALTHDPRLAVVHAETLFEHNGPDVGGEPLDAALKRFAARKREVVGVARILGPGRPRKPSQPAIHTIGTNISQRRRWWRALRQVRACMEDARLLNMRSIGVAGSGVPDMARHGIGADASQQIGHRFGVTQHSENSLNARASDGGKEILQVHLQDDALAHVRRQEGLDRPAFDEPVGGGMRRDLVDYLREYLPLQLFQPRLGRFNQSNRARILSPARDSDNAQGADVWFCTRVL